MATGDGTNYSLTPLMALPVFTPDVCGGIGVEPPGKSWGELLGAALGILDGHNHTPGFGLQVPAAGLNIDADLNFGGNNMIGARSLRLPAQASPLELPSDIGCLYVSGSDLYFNDAIGNQIRLTASGAVVGTPGSIAGLTSPAAATYTPASKLFALTSSSGIGAYLDCGPISIQDPQLYGNSVTIAVPVGMTANYQLTLPQGLPATTKILTVDVSGNMGDTYDVDGSTIEVASSTIRVRAKGITASQVADHTLTGGQMAANLAITVAVPSADANPVTKTYADAIGSAAASALAAKFPAVSWQSASASSPWTGTYYYRIDSLSQVCVRGFIFNSGFGSGDIALGTLPDGYRPSVNLGFALCQTQGASPPAYLTIETNGVMTVRNASASPRTYFFMTIAFTEG